MGKLDSMESKPPLQPPQRPAAAVGAGTGAGAGAGRGGSSNVIVNGNNNNGGELTLKAAAPERIKRDEWSEGAVTTLLDAYESKWLLRNRAKLKGNDWEEVARHVSTRGEGGKSAKTQTQCKNKIESMKKRYRSESASNINNNSSNNGNVSAWPLYARMDNLLRCRTAPLTTPAQPPDLELQEPPPPLMLPPPPPQPPPPPPPQENGHHRVEAEEEPAAEAEADEEEAERQETAAGAGAGPAAGAGAGAGVERSNQEDGSNTLPNRRESAALDTDTSTPRSKIANDPAVKEIAANFNFSCKRRKMSSPGGGGGGSEVAESIRSFADTIVKLEQAKMRMYKDSERLRAETEVRRGEMELKRTEIIANTQLQIAKLLSGKNGKRKLADRNSALALPEAAAHPPPHPLLHD